FRLRQATAIAFCCLNLCAYAALREIFFCMTSRLFSKVLLTNDDGFDAPGLRTLTEVAEELAEEVWIVAPNYDQSGTSHSLSLHSPLRISQKDERKYSVSGTPGDCVAIAVRHLMVSGRPELILSGINRGANLGIETVFSGTVGAAMAGLLLGIPSMALSQAFSDRSAVRWDTARALAPKVIRQFANGDWSQGSILNINFPDVTVSEVGPVELTSQGTGLMEDVDVVSGIDPRSLEYHWIRLRRAAREDTPGSETSAIARGRVSITPLQFERTNQTVLASLQAGLTGT
ncbi:MAG TPA: 5'/3'-nucleotidase SurE, partial [Chthoniobacterales bacterium]|nr:5'/3'-nucleotidase SurE [Chthoniobacterales bacterium]